MKAVHVLISFLALYEKRETLTRRKIRAWASLISGNAPVTEGLTRVGSPRRGDRSGKKTPGRLGELDEASLPSVTGASLISDAFFLCFSENKLLCRAVVDSLIGHYRFRRDTVVFIAMEMVKVRTERVLIRKWRI